MLYLFYLQESLEETPVIYLLRGAFRSSDLRSCCNNPASCLGAEAVFAMSRETLQTALMVCAVGAAAFALAPVVRDVVRDWIDRDAPTTTETTSDKSRRNKLALQELWEKSGVRCLCIASCLSFSVGFAVVCGLRASRRPPEASELSVYPSPYPSPLALAALPSRSPSFVLYRL